MIKHNEMENETTKLEKHSELSSSSRSINKAGKERVLAWCTQLSGGWNRRIATVLRTIWALWESPVSKLKPNKIKTQGEERGCTF